MPEDGSPVGFSQKSNFTGKQHLPEGYFVWALLAILWSSGIQILCPMDPENLNDYKTLLLHRLDCSKPELNRTDRDPCANGTANPVATEQSNQNISKYCNQIIAIHSIASRQYSGDSLETYSHCRTIAIGLSWPVPNLACRFWERWKLGYIGVSMCLQHSSWMFMNVHECSTSHCSRCGQDESSWVGQTRPIERGWQSDKLGTCSLMMKYQTTTIQMRMPFHARKHAA